MSAAPPAKQTGPEGAIVDPQSVNTTPTDAPAPLAVTLETLDAAVERDIVRAARSIAIGKRDVTLGVRPDGTVVTGKPRLQDRLQALRLLKDLAEVKERARARGAPPPALPKADDGESEDAQVLVDQIVTRLQRLVKSAGKGAGQSQLAVDSAPAPVPVSGAETTG